MCGKPPSPFLIIICVPPDKSQPLRSQALRVMPESPQPLMAQSCLSHVSCRQSLRLPKQSGGGVILLVSNLRDTGLRPLSPPNWIYAVYTSLFLISSLSSDARLWLLKVSGEGLPW